MDVKQEANALSRGEVISLALLVADVCFVVLAGVVSCLVTVFLWPKFFKEADAMGWRMAAKFAWIPHLGPLVWILLALVLIAALILKERFVVSWRIRVGINGIMGLASLGYLGFFMALNLLFVYDFLLTLAERFGQ